MRITIRLSALLLVVAVAASLTGERAAAHEGRLVGDGRYEMVVGFLDESAFVGEKNGLQLYVAKLASLATPQPSDATPVAEDEVFDRPVEGLETTLSAEVIYGEERLALTLDTVFGASGEYTAHFFPTMEGDYGFRIFGTVEGVVVDEAFSPSQDGFGPVQPRLEFPAPSSSADRADEDGALRTARADGPGGWRRGVRPPTLGGVDHDRERSLAGLSRRRSCAGCRSGESRIAVPV